MTEAVIIQKPVIDWFLYDNGLRHERVNKNINFSTELQY